MRDLAQHQVAWRSGPLRHRWWAVSLLLVLSACGVTGSVADTVAVVGADRLPVVVETLPASPGSDLADGTATPVASGVANATATAPAVTVITAAAVTAPDTQSVAPRRVAGAGCAVDTVLRSLGLDAFYQKACIIDDLPVVASGVVPDDALEAAGKILEGMLAPRPDLADAMARRRFRLGVIGRDQRAVDLPEYRDLPVHFPRTDWDAARAYGATPQRPLAAAPEENLLCAAEDTYPGQSVLVHELGHSVLDMAVLPTYPGFEARVEAAFAAARSLAVYRNTYAMTNHDEYWAEGVQDFFDASRVAYGPDGGGDGYDGPISSRETLRRYDPALYELIAEVFTDSSWRPSCPSDD